MALGRKRLYNFSVFQQWREITEDHPKETTRKISLLFTALIKGASNLYRLESARKMSSCTKHTVSQSSAYAMILSYNKTLDSY